MKLHTAIKTTVISAILCLSASSANAAADERFYHNKHKYKHHNHHSQYDRHDRHDRHEDRRNYDYVYYPSHSAYYAPASRIWHWNEGANWRSGASLPWAIDIRLAGIPIRLRSSSPHYEHTYVENYYGRPWRASHRHHHDHRNSENRHYDERDERHHNKRW